jgi:hypothetical protein
VQERQILKWKAATDRRVISKSESSRQCVESHSEPGSSKHKVKNCIRGTIDIVTPDVAAALDDTNTSNRQASNSNGIN